MDGLNEQTASEYQEKLKSYDQRKIKTLTAMYKQIAEAMSNYGYEVTATQVTNKFKNCKKTFCKIQKRNGKTSKGRKSYLYEKCVRMFDSFFNERITTK